MRGLAQTGPAETVDARHLVERSRDFVLAVVPHPVRGSAEKLAKEVEKED